MSVAKPNNLEDLDLLIKNYKNKLINNEIILDISDAGYIWAIPDDTLQFILTYCLADPNLCRDTCISVLEKQKGGIAPENLRIISQKIKIFYNEWSPYYVEKILYLLATKKNSPHDVLLYISTLKNAWYSSRDSHANNSTYYQLASRVDVSNEILKNIVKNIDLERDSESNIDTILCLVGCHPSLSEEMLMTLSKMNYYYVASNPKLPESQIDVMLLSGSKVQSDLAKNYNLSYSVYLNLAKNGDRITITNLLKNPKISQEIVEIIYSRSSILRGSASYDAGLFLDCKATPTNIVSSIYRKYQNHYDVLNLICRKIAEHPNVDIETLNLMANHNNPDIRNYVAYSPKAPKKLIEKSKRKSTCYIATSIYGGHDTVEVQLLRKFRDEVMLKHQFGYKIVLLYYLISPKLVKTIGSNKVVKHFVKFLLIDPIVQLIKWCNSVKN